MTLLKPAHRLLLTSSKGKNRTSCICGWQQPRVPLDDGTYDYSVDTAMSKYNRHAGLVERK